MVKELHGKHYYVELGDCYQLAIEAIIKLNEIKEFKDETFGLMKKEDSWIIFSDAKCEEFRGPKYRAWEKFKKEMYVLKKWV